MGWGIELGQLCVNITLSFLGHATRLKGIEGTRENSPSFRSMTGLRTVDHLLHIAGSEERTT
jgi:hypothetical protein